VIRIYVPRISTRSVRSNRGLESGLHHCMVFLSRMVYRLISVTGNVPDVPHNDYHVCQFPASALVCVHRSIDHKVTSSPVSSPTTTFWTGAGAAAPTMVLCSIDPPSIDAFIEGGTGLSSVAAVAAVDDVVSPPEINGDVMEPPLPPIEAASAASADVICCLDHCCDSRRTTASGESAARSAFMSVRRESLDSRTRPWPRCFPSSNPMASNQRRGATRGKKHNEHDKKAQHDMHICLCLHCWIVVDARLARGPWLPSGMIFGGMASPVGFSLESGKDGTRGDRLRGIVHSFDYG
jgi:hypothetical protein